MKTLSLISLLAFFLSFSLQAAKPTESRTWTSTKGSKVKAIALSVENGKVKLKRSNGKTINVQISQLSAEDKTFLAEHFGSDSPASETNNEVKSDMVETENVPPTDLDLKLGIFHTDLPCGDHHYHIFLPKTLRKGEKHPVIFTFSPAGGKAKDLNHYRLASIRNGYILVLSKESSNRYPKRIQAAEEMISHVLKTYDGKIDKDRMIFSGFSGAARLSHVLKDTAKFGKPAAIIAFGAGSYSGDRANSNLLLYSLCGNKDGNCPDVSGTFKTYKNRNNILSFFSAKHTWATPKLVEEALTYVNGHLLLKNKSNYSKATVDSYLASVHKLLEENKEADPERATLWADFLMNKMGDKTVASTYNALIAVENNSKFLDGFYGMGKFASKKLSNNPYTRKLTAKEQRSCSKEARKYVGTSWEKVLKEMSEP